MKFTLRELMHMGNIAMEFKICVAICRALSMVSKYLLFFLIHKLTGISEQLCSALLILAIAYYCAQPLK